MNNRKSITRRELLAGATGVAGGFAWGCGSREAKAARPNIVVILADDMGFADPGCFGGEIDTPNLNRLAAGGLRYTSFYSTARCCPTRASLLSGLYPHQTGMGWMTAANLGRPAYSGNLNRRCVTIGEALQPAGYSTYLAGKWHVVRDLYTTPAGPKDNWPLQRGFDRFFGTLLGAGNYFDPATLTRDNEPIQAGEGFYYTDAISDNAVRFITDHRTSRPDQPFFLYTAYTAPHWPLHAKPEDIEKHRGRYTKGWEPLRRERHARMIEAGIVDPKWRLSQPDPAVKDWGALSSEQKQDMALRMAIYAAQVDSMDQGIGRILQSLEETGALDNTLLLFFSDNGACQEEIHSGAKGISALGKKESFESYGRSWANAGNTPFRLYKHYVHEGGIASPLIVHWPERIRSGGELRRQPGHVIDVMATALDVAGGTYPAEYKGNAITPIEGKSLVPSLDNQPIVRDAIFWEHEGNQAVRQGDWKVVSTGIGGEWELYNLAADRTETNNLAASEPERVERMTAAWQQWAERCDVLPLDGRTWGERLKASVD